ncbi:MAG TPA: BrnA antitoxin family protein [Thermoanaerobaculia bacterium]|nr:BrnA antitoxin family protein [Thermoanaerobaculia bacterium]
MRDEDIVLADEHPELDVQHVVKVIRRYGLKPAPPKASVSLRLDRDVLDWFKAQGPGYQTRINLILRAFRDASI